MGPLRSVRPLCVLCAMVGLATYGATSFLFPTSVSTVFRIPGRSWSGGRMTEKSLGPWGYAVVRGKAAVLVDVPYFSGELAEEVRRRAPGGVSHIFLTHDDFVGMSGHASWKAEFPDVVRVAHSADCSPERVEVSLKGDGPWEIDGFQIDHVPGHSEGSVFYSSRDLSAVFTGDSIAHWAGAPTGFGSHCRFGHARQAASLRSFAKRTDFRTALFPGHGMPAVFTSPEERSRFFMEAAKGLDGKDGF